MFNVFFLLAFLLQGKDSLDVFRTKPIEGSTGSTNLLCWSGCRAIIHRRWIWAPPHRGGSLKKCVQGCKGWPYDPKGDRDGSWFLDVDDFFGEFLDCLSPLGIKIKHRSTIYKLSIVPIVTLWIWTYPVMPYGSTGSTWGNVPELSGSGYYCTPQRYRVYIQMYTSPC